MAKDNNNKSSSSSSSNTNSSIKKKATRVPKQKGIPIDVPSNNQMKGKAKKAKKAKKIAKSVIRKKSEPHDYVPYAMYTKPMHEQRDILSSPSFLKPKGYNLKRGRLGLEW